MTDSWEFDFRNVGQNLPKRVFECAVPSRKRQLWNVFSNISETKLRDWCEIDFGNVAQNLPKRVFECSVPSWKSQLWKRFFQHFSDTDERLLGNWFRKCGSRTAKTSFWVSCTLVEKSGLEVYRTFLRHTRKIVVKSSSETCLGKVSWLCKIFDHLCSFHVNQSPKPRT